MTSSRVLFNSTVYYLHKVLDFLAQKHLNNQEKSYKITPSFTISS
jgi:two-component SAPR family response regulator